MGYTASVLEQHGYQADILECPGQGINLKTLYDIIEREQYDVISIATNYFDYKVELISIKRVVNAIKKRVPSVFIAAGGYLATLNYNLILSTIENIDCCILGEGEVTSPELVKAVANREYLSDVKGIAFRKGNSIVKTPPRPYIKDLDSLPYPRRKFINQEIKAVGLMTSRGCYNNCTFCVDKEFHKSNDCIIYRQRSVENEVEEIEYLINNYDFKRIYIYDVNFLGVSKQRQEWMHKFIDIMQSKGISIPFRIETRAIDIIANEKIMGKLKEIGLWRIFIGIESFIQRQLNSFEKNTTVEQNIKTLEICRDAGIWPEYGFLMLEPFVTIDEILNNVRIIRDLKLYEFSYPCQELLSPSERRLVAPPGVRANSAIRDKSIDADNYFSYEFVNSDITLFFNITKLWEKGMESFYPLYYLFNKVLDEQSDIARTLINGNIMAKKLDVEFVEELALKIKNRDITKAEDASGMLDSWYERMREVFAPYIPIKKLIESQLCA